MLKTKSQAQVKESKWGGAMLLKKHTHNKSAQYNIGDQLMNVNNYNVKHE